MNTDYTFRRLSSDEVLDIYENSCPLHFPAPEKNTILLDYLAVLLSKRNARIRRRTKKTAP